MRIQLHDALLKMEIVLNTITLLIFFNMHKNIITMKGKANRLL